MDETDKKILNILEKDGRTAFVDVAKEVGITEGAVRKRVKELVETETIKKFTIVTGPEKKIKSLILLNTNPQIPIAEISDKVRKIVNVKEVYELSGDYDIIAFIEAENLKEINKTVDLIREVKGVTKTITTFVLR